MCCPSPRRTRMGARAWRFSFDKEFHVSPFLPMDMRYDWYFGAPGKGLHVHMENWRDGEARFDATLNLARQEMTAGSLARALIQFPLITARVTASSTGRRSSCWWKRTPFHAHPVGPIT